MTPSTNHPWWPDVGDDVIVIRDKDGDAVCVLERPDDVNERLSQDALAELIAMAPELFCRLHELAGMLLRRDFEAAQGLEVPVNDFERDAALDDAQALLDLLAESGVTAGEPE